MSFQQSKRKRISVLSGLVTFLVVGFLMIALFFIGISILLLLVIPVIIFVIIGIVVYRYSGESKKYCPRCNVPTSVYTEYCRNCVNVQIAIFTCTETINIAIFAVMNSRQ